MIQNDLNVLAALATQFLGVNNNNNIIIILLLLLCYFYIICNLHRAGSWYPLTS
jgi:hypothetical protein